ncbi:MAG: arylsulfatase [Blastocatellia bacterium]
MNRCKIITSFLVSCLALAGWGVTLRAQTAQRPNIIYILADDMGYRDLSVFGQQARQTPNLDKLARNGMIFNHAYAGAAMCAASRAVLMTGMHLGHARVRENASLRGGQDNLNDSDITVAEALKQAGYKTALTGKWGIGLPGTAGEPHKQGFDLAYGFYDQAMAHGFYPEYLMHNGQREPLPQNEGFKMARVYQYGSTPMARMTPDLLNQYDAQGRNLPDGVADPAKASYSQDLIHAKAMQFVRENQANPFFLYYATQLPHGPLIAKDLGKYKDAPWDIKHKEWAAMIDHLDRHVGELVALLEELKLLDNTIIFFASDNGYEPNYFNLKRYERDPVFANNGPWPGGKFLAREGGIRTPMFAYWRGRIKAGGSSDHPTAFYDFLATAAELAGVKRLHTNDGISIVPTLLGKPQQQRKHEYLYWEQCTVAQPTRHIQTVRYGDYHAYREHPTKPMELYDIVRDPECKTNLFASQPAVVKKIEGFMRVASTPNEWFITPGDTPEQIKAKKERGKLHPLPLQQRANGMAPLPGPSY